MYFFGKIRNNLKFSLIIITSFLFLLGGISCAEDDLLWQLVEPTYYEDITINAGKSSKTVGNRFFGNSTEVDFVVEKKIRKDNKGNPLCHDGECAPGCDGNVDRDECKYQHVLVEVKVTDKPSIIVKITRILLSFIVALSVTMVLYNGMMYIIQSGQGKEAKDLTKNIAYIVIGILVALFSIVIITLIQSVTTTIDKEWESGQKMDQEMLVSYQSISANIYENRGNISNISNQKNV